MTATGRARLVRRLRRQLSALGLVVMACVVGVESFADDSPVPAVPVPAVPVPAVPVPAVPVPAVPWCAPELTALSDRVCFFGAEANPARTLVVFLHGLTSAAPKAAWPLQRRLAENAKAYGFSALVPKGRAGAGPGRDPKILAWPTALELQPALEPEIFAEWRAAIAAAEKAQGGGFERVLLFGFSNGAYYATNLAFRDAFSAEGAAGITGIAAFAGVAAFAGGSGSKYQRLLAERTKRRVPVFVGYGTTDPDHLRQEQMIDMLREVRWPHQVLAAKVGHGVTDAQIRSALQYLGHPVAARR